MNAITQHLMAELGLSEDEAQDRLSGWEIVPITSGDIEVGHLAKQDSEIHTVLYPEYRHKPMTAVIKLYKKLLKTNFFLTTRVPLTDEAGISISERVGFREVRRDNDWIYYWMDETTLLGGKHAAQ